MTSSHSFHSIEAEKGPISFTFGHTHTGMVDTKWPPWGRTDELGEVGRVGVGDWEGRYARYVGHEKLRRERERLRYKNDVRNGRKP